jgi:aspartyl protease family protein
MSLSSGTRNLFVEIASWMVVAGVVVFSLTHYDRLKGMMAVALGLPKPGQTATATVDRDGASAPAQATGATVEIPAGQGGHFYTQAEINGRSVDVLVDTGATTVFLSYETAESVGIYLKPSDFTHISRTANGNARIAPVTLDRVSIGDITVRQVQAAVAEPGKLTTATLLGMSFLGRVSNVGMRGGVLVLQD